MAAMEVSQKWHQGLERGKDKDVRKDVGNTEENDWRVDIVKQQVEVAARCHPHALDKITIWDFVIAG